MTDQPKRRGRPPKAKPCAECGQTVGHYDDCSVGLGVMGGNTPEISPPSVDPRAQAYALRVWNGQSHSETRTWRMERVRLALEGQGLSMEGVELP